METPDLEQREEPRDDEPAGEGRTPTYHEVPKEEQDRFNEALNRGVRLDLPTP